MVKINKNRKLKILVIRFSSIGDIVLTTPVLRAVKWKFDRLVETHFVTKKAFGEILSNNPYVDQLHLHEGKLSALTQKLRKERFDLIIDLHNSTRSNILTFHLNRPAVRFRKLNLRKWMLTRLKINRMPNVHVVDRYLDTLRVLGVSGDGKGLDYFFPEKMPAVQNLLPESFHKGYIAFAIGGLHTTKRLPNEKIIAVIQKLGQPVVLLGDHNDAHNGDLIVRANGHNTFNACGQFSLDESAWVVKHASVMITHDSGLMHIAAAFNKPMVSIWGNTVPDFGMTPFMPAFSNRSKIIEVNGLSCRPCSKLGYRKCPRKHFDCMMKMDESQIAEEVSKLSITDYRLSITDEESSKLDAGSSKEVIP